MGVLELEMCRCGAGRAAVRGANPSPTPVHLSGPKSGDESLLPLSLLLIEKDGESRSIWQLHTHSS